MYGGVDVAAVAGTYTPTTFESLIAPTCFTVKSHYPASRPITFVYLLIRYACVYNIKI